MALADAANVFVNDKKALGARQAGRQVKPNCTPRVPQAIEAFRLLTLYLKPVLPKVAEAVESFLNIAPLDLEGRGDAASRPATRFKAYNHLMTRIDPKQIAALVAANTVSTGLRCRKQHLPSRMMKDRRKKCPKLSPKPETDPNAHDQRSRIS